MRTVRRERASIRSLRRRLRELNKTASEKSKLHKSWLRTPVQQRPPALIALADESGLTDVQWAHRATLLCAATAHMRGRVHFKGEIAASQRQRIEEDIVGAEAYERAMLKAGKVVSHPTVPSWLRETLRAAIDARAVIEEERARTEALSKRLPAKVAVG